MCWSLLALLSFADDPLDLWPLLVFVWFDDGYWLHSLHRSSDVADD